MSYYILKIKHSHFLVKKCTTVHLTPDSTVEAADVLFILFIG